MLIGDTLYPPGPPSYGSRTTASITPPARVAAWKLLQQVFAAAAPALDAAPGDLVALGGRIVTRTRRKRGMSFAAAAALDENRQARRPMTRSEDYGGFRRAMGEAAQAQQDIGGVQFAEVAVDAETGIVRVERIVAVQDCGRPINPLLLESQIQGGVLMGVSYALYENRVLDRSTGRMVNANLEQYKVVGPREVPPIEVVVLENLQGRSATDAYGVAEPANIATAPAIGNAVFNAIGVRLRSLPMTPRGGARGPRGTPSEELTPMRNFASHAPNRRRGGGVGRPRRRRDAGGRRAARVAGSASSRRAAST